MISREGNRLSTRNDEVFRGVLAVVGGKYIRHIMAGKCGRSVKTHQVHRDQMWRGVERHAWTVVQKVMGSLRGLTAADVRGSAVVSVVKSVRQGEFPDNAAIDCARKHLVGPRVETHPAVPTMQEGTSYYFIGDDVYPYRKRCGGRIIMVELASHSGLSVCAEQLLGAEATPRSGCRRSDVGFVGGVGGCHLLESTLVYERLGRSRIQEGAAAELRCGGGAAC